MKIFGSITKLVSLVFQKGANTVTVEPVNQSGNNTLNIPDIGAGVTKKAVITGNGAVTANSVPRMDTTDGAIVKSTSVVIDDTNNITGVTSITVGNTGLTVGSSTPFSDSTGTLTLQNVDALDSTTEATIESAIDTLANLTSIQSQTVTLSGSLTVESASTINQDLTTDASPTFASVKIDENGAGTETVEIVAPTVSGNQTITLPAVTGTLATLAGTETLTNKYLDGGTASATNKWKLPSDTYANIALLTPTEGLTVYATDTDTVYVGDGTNWVAVGSSSGSGEKNYIENPSAASAITGWNNVGDLDVARTTTASDLPREYTTGSGIKITADANTQSTADYVYYDFTLDDVDLNKKLKISWAQKMTGTYASGDLAVIITSQADRTTALHTPVTTSLPNVDGVFTTSFDSGSTATLSLVIRATTDMATNGGLVISDVVVGPGSVVTGAVVDKWVTCTMTTTNVNSTVVAKYRRVGDSAQFTVNVTATGNATGNVILNMPSGMTIDNTVTTTDAQFGSGYVFDTSGSLFYNISPSQNGVQNNILFRCQGELFVSASDPGPDGFDSGDTLFANFTVPIAEWAGSGTVNLGQNNVEFLAWNGSTTVFGPAGASIPNIAGSTGSTSYTLVPQARFQNGDKLSIELIDSAGDIRGETNFPFIAGTSSYAFGVYVEGLASGSISVTFGNGGANTNGGLGAASSDTWASLSASWKWRVIKTSAGAAVGFGTVSENSAGLMPASNSNLDNASATRLGFKRYLHGTTYNGGNAPTITLAAGGGTLSSVQKGVFVPYVTQDGTWRLRFNCRVTLSSATRTGATFDVNGVLVSDYQQAVSGYSLNAGGTLQYAVAQTSSATVCEIVHASIASTAYAFSGDIELTSKPTWAY